LINQQSDIIELAVGNYQLAIKYITPARLNIVRAGITPILYYCITASPHPVAELVEALHHNKRSLYMAVSFEYQTPKQ
jgi:hypothetical protein